MFRHKRPYVKRRIAGTELNEKIFNPQMVELTQYIPSDMEELIYVANEENEELNKLFENHLGFINEVASVFKLRVVYVPLIHRRIQEEEVQRYIVPDGHSLKKLAKIGNDYMFRYLVNPRDRQKMAHGFIWNKGVFVISLDEEVSFKSEFFALSFSSKNSIPQQIYEIFRIIESRRDSKSGISRYAYLAEEGSKDPEDYAETRFNSQEWEEDINDLMDEIKERVEKLRQRGIAEQILIDLLRPQARLSSLVITHDYRLVLPDFHLMEIKLEPLVKAVYFLFLRHPEGIMFKTLPDYRQELTEIYLQLKPNGLTDRVKKSIEDVTDPTKNSINEKCARIRGAFLEQFDNHLAKHYYIDGLRAEPKKIAISRELVVWE